MLDHFYMSDAGYHELTMHTLGSHMPRSYIVKECRHKMNSFRVLETIAVGDVKGAQYDFYELLQDEIIAYLKDAEISGDDGGAPVEEIMVKIAGDGATMSRNSSFQMLSFTLLNRRPDMLKTGNVRTVVCVNGSESYETLRDGMGKVFEQINQLVKDGTITVNGQTFPVEVFMCGDFKYKQKVLGLKDSTADQGCPHCLVKAADHHDMTKPVSYYDEGDMARSLQKMQSGELQPGQKHKPLLKFPLGASSLVNNLCCCELLMSWKGMLFWRL